MRLVVVTALVTFIATVSACATDGSRTAANPVTSEVRQVDDSGSPLPFETKHSHRWNNANDGTRYEPCTALPAFAVDAEGWDSSTARDAAGSNGQTLRGCTWTGQADQTGRWILSQFVGNSPNLERAKSRSPSDPYTVWMQDLTISERTVGILAYRDGSRCETYVQSNKAGVYTAVSAITTDQPPISEICDRALAFTRATIGKMPV
ncbi:DUF3558 family protein [Gordonia zhenghanii]|uniref:DUF3558 family protein n=1 Tax=Gordonia zhenghanii TaxID=2911516 RepID=UPI0035AB8220